MQARKKSDNRINKALTCPNGAAKFKLNQLLVSSGNKTPPDFLQKRLYYGLIFANLCENKAVAILEKELAWNDSSWTN